MKTKARATAILATVLLSNLTIGSAYKGALIVCGQPYSEYYSCPLGIPAFLDYTPNLLISWAAGAEYSSITPPYVAACIYEYFGVNCTGDPVFGRSSKPFVTQHPVNSCTAQ